LILRVTYRERVLDRKDKDPLRTLGEKQKRGIFRGVKRGGKEGRIEEISSVNRSFQGKLNGKGKKRFPLGGRSTDADFP